MTIETNIEVKISQGNSKMGIISSVSLPTGITCRDDCECIKKCYAKKIERLRPSVRKTYENNYQILKSDPALYWREIETSIKMSRFFRFHVAGDIPDRDYLECMVKVAYNNPKCEILCFTKKYSIVNEYIHANKCIPDNLHIVFSGWRGIPMDNPYNLPEAHVRYRDGTTTARDDAHECLGNCTKCAIIDTGCWVLKSGEQIIFNEH